MAEPGCDFQARAVLSLGTPQLSFKTLSLLSRDIQEHRHSMAALPTQPCSLRAYRLDVQGKQAFAVTNETSLD